MTDMLVELIQNFISGSESTLNSVFNSMLNLVFYIERELMYIPEGAILPVHKIDFNAIYQIVFNYATYLLIIVFIVKAVKTYLLMKDGENKLNKQNKKGNRYKENTKKKVKTNKKLIPNIILIFFIILLVFSGFKIIMWFLNNRENKKIAEEISQAIIIDEENVEEKEKYKVDFQALKEKNSDTVGFLKVNGTNIEYTVVKGTNNSCYLKHNFNKESNSAGWIFADYKNKVDGTDKNLVIYGHNMRNDSMFGSLKNILNDDWHNEEENKYVTFITENDNSIYEVFSVYQVVDEDYYITTDFKDNEFNDFIKTIKSRSKFDFGVDVNENDNILTLSTCANNNKYRVVLHAKKIIE